MPMDRLTFILITHNVPSISESLSGIFEPYYRKLLKEDARKAGYDDVDKYRLDLFRNDPTRPARAYLECVNEYGAKSASCNTHRKRWLDCKAWQSGNRVTWNEEEIDKLLKKDAIKAGYKEGYFRNKDPEHLAVTARLYDKCVAKHGGDNSLCKYQEKNWLKCKAVQDESFRERLKEDARKAGYDDLDRYLLDRSRKDPTDPARRYLECINEHGNGSRSCDYLKSCWLAFKALQNGYEVTWNEEGVDKMLMEDAIKGGYKEGYKKTPEYLASIARLYEKCVAKSGAEHLFCKQYEKHMLECKAAKNVA